MEKVHVTIDGIQVYVPDTYTVLEAAKEINIHIPTLCFLKDVSEIGCCRMCLVEVKGSRALQAACGYPVNLFCFRSGFNRVKLTLCDTSVTVCTFAFVYDRESVFDSQRVKRAGFYAEAAAFTFIFNNLNCHFVFLLRIR